MIFHFLLNLIASHFDYFTHCWLGNSCIMTISCAQKKDFELETKDAFVKCLNCCITMMLHAGDGTLTENEFVDGCMSDEAFVKVRTRAVERVVRDPK